MSKSSYALSASPLIHTTMAILAALKPGQRYTHPCPAGSSDAWLLAELAVLAATPLVILVADPLEAQRYTDELAIFAPQLRIRQFIDWETLPYDAFSPHQDLISQRLETLHALILRSVDILVVPIITAIYYIAPPSFLAAYRFSFKQRDKLDEEALRAQLTLANYVHVDQVSSPGEFCFRGGIIDIFPMGSTLPYRLDLFDNEIESIRSFDCDTQRSLYPVAEIQLLPGREFPMDEQARNSFRSRFREYFEGDPSRALPYKDVGNGIAFAGIEYYLPLFFDQPATLFDYLTPKTLMITSGDLDEAIRSFSVETRSRYEFLKNDRQRPVLPPETLFLETQALYAKIKPFARLALTTSSTHPDFIDCPDVAVLRRSEDPFAKLHHLLKTVNHRVLLCASSAGRYETLSHQLNEHGFSSPTASKSIEDFLVSNTHFNLTVAALNAGFAMPAQGLLFITENDLYPEQTVSTRRNKRAQERASDVQAMVRDLSELRAGDPVVHSQYGIGRYHGLVNMDLGEGEMEFLHLEYAHASALYVPVSQLHVIARYSGSQPDTAPLHQLGSGQWEKARRKAAQQIRDAAAELLELYARRAARTGFEFKLPLSDYDTFAESFGFEETPDQAAAIQVVIQDMRSIRPMDRLVCGDVGFGKTEVALRAAFLAVSNHKQVALLCPTTLLTEQHTQTFIDRFAQWPIRVVELSRFKSAKEIAVAVKDIQEGRADIIVGTHKILSKTIKFKDLGLVIIDEEHRFGVRQKEVLKTLRTEVDILTLTATPIPRTLGMTLEGIRDFSVIATAPQKRLAIKTFVRNEDKAVIREALLRELKRGGQVYFLHNEVQSIYQRRTLLEEIVPEARIVVAHGQMPERELEQAMKDFYQQRYNVLLCTTIIETGIDVATANTIVIHRADKLGLAQLHQLRGRVGRSHHQAYAYLLIPDKDMLSSNAKKRLEAIQTMEELGSGFYLAMHDLEIRGTGEVLGDAQSGNIHEIGFAMYHEMLNEAIRALKTGEEPNLESPLNSGCEINLHTPALLPSDYCSDVHMRLSLYKRLAHIKDEDSLINLQEELIDRFGKLPDAAKALIATHRIRLQATLLGIIKVDASEDVVVIQFSTKPLIDPIRIIQLVQKERHIKLAGPDKLRVEIKGQTITARIDALRAVLKMLA